MAIIIDTSAAASLTINDANTADLIAVDDGPVENGFQTTQVQTGGDLTIFANKTAVTIDGGNQGDQVVFDNPDPADGLQTLTVQNLGTGGTIDGSNPDATGADIAVATLDLTADAGIGNGRALRTQASSLFAAAGLSGAPATSISPTAWRRR